MDQAGQCESNVGYARTDCNQTLGEGNSVSLGIERGGWETLTVRPHSRSRHQLAHHDMNLSDRVHQRYRHRSHLYSPSAHVQWNESGATDLKPVIDLGEREVVPHGEEEEDEQDAEEGDAGAEYEHLDGHAVSEAGKHI